MTGHGVVMNWTWSLDQALIWVTTRNTEVVEDAGYRWVYLGLDLGDELDNEWRQRNIVVPPREACRELIKSISSGGVEAFAGGEPLDPAWLNGARLAGTLR